MIAAGFAPGSEFLWDDHYGVYWDLTQRIYREELDPDYDGAITGGIPFCQSGTPMLRRRLRLRARGRSRAGRDRARSRTPAGSASRC